MGKHTDKLGSFDDFKAPWETEAGEDAEIDKPKLKRLVFNARLGEAKAQDAKIETDEALVAAEKALEEAKDEAADANGVEAQKKIDRLQKKVDDLTAEKTAREEADEAKALRDEVIGDLDPKYAKYVKGETREELEESLEDVKKDFGLDDGNDDGDEDEDEDEPKVRTRPRANLKNVADKESGKGADAEIDFDAVADSIVGTSIFH